MRNVGEISNFVAKSFLDSCDVTSFSSETQNENNQGKKRGLFISRHVQSAQPYLKQP
jgi:hypothetical protein